MLQSSSIVQERHQTFIKRVVEFNTVWALSFEEGFAVSSSNEDEDIAIILFWSDAAYARAVAKDGWSDYVPVSFSLAEFLENWMVGMHQDHALAGTNWDANMFGVEAEPLKLALEIVEALKAKDMQLIFTKYADLADFEAELRQALENVEE